MRLFRRSAHVVSATAMVTRPLLRAAEFSGQTHELLKREIAIENLEWIKAADQRNLGRLWRLQNLPLKPDTAEHNVTAASIHKRPQDGAK